MNDDGPELGYARLSIERMAERRDDAAFIEEEAARGDARVLAFAGDALVLAGEDGGPLLDAADLAALGPSARAAYLGRHHGAPRFAASLVDVAGENGPPAADLRSLAIDGRLAGEALALGGYAKSMAAWHARHRFCSNCGAETESGPSGWRRVCASCGALHFPRVDPVVIMLVTRGDRCLLGRQGRFPPGMWSCLAGFVEPGETMEDAARREISEEAGLAVGEVAYELSQPWPFPSQLMLGVSCEAASDEITPDLEELEDARWFSREEAAQMLARTHADGLFAPPSSAIAHHLLRRFVQRG